MADYTVEWAAALDPSTILGELPIVSLSYSDVLNGPGSVSGTIPLNPWPGTPDLLSAGTFAPAQTVVWVRRDKVMMWGGLVWGVRASVEADTLSFQGAGWHSWTRRQIIPQTLVYTAVDQAQIVKGLIESVTALNNPLGIVVPSATHGVTRDRTYYWWDGKNLGEAIDQLAAVINGFDFRYTSADDYSITFTTEYPASGRSTNHVFELGVNVELVNYEVDGSGVATRWLGFGSGQGQSTLYTTAFNSSTPYPLLQAVESWPDVTSAATLAEHVNDRIARSVTPPILVELAHYPGTVPGLGSYEVGDRCWVTAKRGYIQMENELYRITSRDVTVDEDGGETVRVQLAPIGLFT